MNNNQISQAIKHLQEGKIIIYDTDTLPGFGVDATNTQAVKNLNLLKKRMQPMSIIINDLLKLEDYAFNSPEIMDEIKKIIPGQYTLLLKAKASNIAKEVFCGSEKIGIRIPKNTFAINLTKLFGKPITTTSINIHGSPALIKKKEIIKQFPSIPNFMEEKNMHSSKGSTIIDFTIYPFKVVRLGDGKYPV